ncbi:hypothetical protein EWM64_g9199, partial [Hericium alpestre]
ALLARKAGRQGCLRRHAVNLCQHFMVHVDAWCEAYAQSIQPLVDEAIEESIKSKEAATNSSQLAKCQKGMASGSQEAASGSKASGSKKCKRGAETIVQPVVQVTMSEHWKEVEDIDLDLPSVLHTAAHALPALANALRVELELQWGQANEALDNLQFHLITQALALTLRRGALAVMAAAEMYRWLCKHLLTIGLDPEDTTFCPLAAADVKIFMALDTEQQLGDSHKQPSWLWSDFRFLEIKDGIINPEMLSYFKKLWERKAEDHKELQDRPHAAYVQKQAAQYGVLHRNSLTLFKDAVEVSSL